MLLFITSLICVAQEGETDIGYGAGNAGMAGYANSPPPPPGEDDVMMISEDYAFESSSAKAMPTKMSRSAPMSADMTPPSMNTNLGGEFLSNLDSDQGGTSQEKPQEQMLIKDGTLSLSAAFTSSDPSSTPSNVQLVPSHTTFKSLTEIIREEISKISKAYVENERASSYEHYVSAPYNSRRRPPYTVRRNTLSITAKVPSNSFEDFFKTISSLANTNTGIQLTERSANVQDVTSSYIDTVSRIGVLESSEKALRRLMESASTTRDVLDVEKQLRKVITDKEKNTKQKAFYEKGVAFSTVRLTLNERAPVTKDEDPIDDVGWDPMRTVSKALKKLESGIVILIDALIYTFVWAVPVLGAIWVFKIVWSKGRKTGGGGSAPVV